MGPERLFILRHAKSSWDDPALDDHDRPLSSRGRRASVLVGRYLTERRIVPDLVLCSSALRARQTLELLGLDTVETIEDDLYGASAIDLLARLRRLDAGVSAPLLVGHNPGIEDLAATAAGDPSRLAAFPTAALAEFRVVVRSWSDLTEGALALETFVTPRDLSNDDG